MKDSSCENPVDILKSSLDEKRKNRAENYKSCL